MNRQFTPMFFIFFIKIKVGEHRYVNPRLFLGDSQVSQRAPSCHGTSHDSPDHPRIRTEISGSECHERVTRMKIMYFFVHFFTLCDLAG